MIQLQWYEYENNEDHEARVNGINLITYSSDFTAHQSIIK